MSSEPDQWNASVSDDGWGNNIDSDADNDPDFVPSDASMSASDDKGTFADNMEVNEEDMYEIMNASENAATENTSVEVCEYLSYSVHMDDVENNNKDDMKDTRS